ncbi:MarR family transcriptional regulator [Shumkonia mesophila]
MDQGSLADILAMDTIVLVRLLDRLEEAGFIVRMPDPFA